MKKYSIVFTFGALVFLALPVFTFAACVSGVTNYGPGQYPCSAIGSVDISSPIGNGNVDPVSGAVTTYSAGSFVASIIGLVNWFSWFIGLAAVVMGLYAGWLFITGGDNAAQIASARKVMLYAIIGIAVAIISFGIIAISRNILGL